MIPDRIIDQIRDHSDIVRALQQAGLPLRRRGSVFICCCPFHQEQTPSFTVNIRKQTWRCYGAGCDKGGDVFRYFQESEGLDFPSAVRRVADLEGLSYLLSAT